MAVQRTGGPQGPPPAAAGDVDEPRVTTDAPPVAPTPRALDAKADLRTRTAAEQRGARGNLAAILSDQLAGRPPAADLASVASLTRGEAFGARAAASVERVMGQPVTREGLERLYGSVLPDTHVFVRGVGEDWSGRALDFAVEWKDNAGHTVAKLNRRMARHEDGDLELYSHGCWVEPSHRSRAVSAAVMQREIELLQNLSPHPRSRLTLWAGGVTDPKDQDNFETVGHYVWATMGFDCVQRHGPRSRLPRGGANKSRCAAETKEDWDTHDFPFVQRMAERWVHRAAERGDLPHDPALLDDLVEAFRACEDMWSIATLDVPGLAVDVRVGGLEAACHVGKAFLLSADSPRWEGAFFVRRPEFLEVGEGYCKPRVARAEQAFAADQAHLVEALEGGDEPARRAALAEVAERGDAALAPLLERVRDAEPALAEAAQAALDGVTGVTLTRALFAQSLDAARSVKARLRSLDLALERSPDRRTRALLNLLEAPKTRGDFEVARTALTRLARAEVDADTLLDAAHGLWRRASAPAPDAEPSDAPTSQWGRPERDGAWQRRKTRAATLECIDSVASARATDVLGTIADAEPDRELSGAARAAWLTRVGRERPDDALEAGRAFIEASRATHAELERGDRRRSEEARARNQIIEAIGGLSTDAAIAFLERAVDLEPFYEAIRIALDGLERQLGEAQPDRVAAHAARWLRSATNSEQMRADCVEILGRCPSPVARRALLEAARNETEARPLRALDRALDDLEGAAEVRATVLGRLAALAAKGRARTKKDGRW